MKQFAFRLERILRLRSQAEREQARVLGSARQGEDARRLRLEEASVQLGRCGQQILAGASEVKAAGTMDILGLTVSEAAGRVEAASASHQEAEDAVRQQEDTYHDAKRERRVLEKLRERRQTLWSQESSREEQKDMDAQALRQRPTGEEK